MDEQTSHQEQPLEYLGRVISPDGRDGIKDDYIIPVVDHQAKHFSAKLPFLQRLFFRFSSTYHVIDEAFHEDIFQRFREIYADEGIEKKIEGGVEMLFKKPDGRTLTATRSRLESKVTEMLSEYGMHVRFRVE